jgi:hypothetical protein
MTPESFGSSNSHNVAHRQASKPFLLSSQIEITADFLFRNINVEAGIALVIAARGSAKPAKKAGVPCPNGRQQTSTLNLPGG